MINSCNKAKVSVKLKFSLMTLVLWVRHQHQSITIQSTSAINKPLHAWKLQGAGAVTLCQQRAGCINSQKNSYIIHSKYDTTKTDTTLYPQ
jgi:hypothetical protein